MSMKLNNAAVAAHVHSSRNAMAALGRLAGALAISLAAGAALADVPALSVSGNQVLIGGKPGSISGSSLYWSNNGWPGERFYNAGAVGWLKDDWKATLVRAAMGVEEPGGYISSPAANKARVKAVVDAAIAKDIYVIIDWHSHYAFRYQNEAIAFFQEMARTYGNNKHVIYEIYNEPKDDVTWDGNVRPYAQAVIAAIRAIDPDNLIIVGSPHWSQDADIAARNPISGHTNIAYTLHFYAGTHFQFLRDKAASAMNNGLALFVTEWGSVNADGNGGVNYGETNAWIDFMQKHNLSNANWALDDAREGSASLVPGASSTGGWANWDLTESGKQARETVRNWPPVADGGGCATASVPSTIEAEAFCQMSGVQLETTSDAGGGRNVGYIDSGDWMNYTVDVPAAGLYTVSYRVASASGGGSISLERAGGSPVFGAIAVNATGGWQNWSTISHTVQLPAGKQSIGIAAKAGGFNLNWIGIAPAASNGQIALIQAEDFASMSGVDTEQTTDAGGGRNASYIDTGDWMSYTNQAVTIPETGTYTIEFRVASQGGGELSFEEAGGKPAYATVAVPATGGWQNWASVNKTVTLNAGSHSFGVYAKQGGWNLNWIKVSKGAR